MIALMAMIVTIITTAANMIFTHLSNKKKFQHEREKIEIENQLKALTQQQSENIAEISYKIDLHIASVRALQDFRDFVMDVIRAGKFENTVLAQKLSDDYSTAKDSVFKSYSDLLGHYPKGEIKFVHNAKMQLAKVGDIILENSTKKKLFPSLSDISLYELETVHQKLSSTQEELRIRISLLQNKKSAFV